MEDKQTPKPSFLRWKILRRAILRRYSSDPVNEPDASIESVSRKAKTGFNLIPCHPVEGSSDSLSDANHSVSSREACVCYTLPIDRAHKLFIYQRIDNCADLDDFKICNTYDIDNTGLICPWPSEEVLAFYCLSHVDKFRSKRVIELGSGYGLAGLVIAVTSEALEVVISDGNPQVVDYIQRNINANSVAFGGTIVKSLMLHWNQEEISGFHNNFDVIVASDCTFFKEFHKGLAQTIKCLLTQDGSSEAIFFSPKRGDSLDRFLVEVKESGLPFTVEEIYDAEVWKRHQGFINRDGSWPNYEMDHCYPLLPRLAELLGIAYTCSSDGDSVKDFWVQPPEEKKSPVTGPVCDLYDVLEKLKIVYNSYKVDSYLDDRESRVCFFTIRSRHPPHKLAKNQIP